MICIYIPSVITYLCCHSDFYQTDGK